MIYANLRNANLDGADFPQSDCRWAIFVSTSGRNGNFSGANLEGTLWVNADLESANLSNARLNGADLLNAKLNRTVLSKTELGKGRRPIEEPPYRWVAENYTRVTQAQLDQAIATEFSPPSIDPETVDAGTRASLIWRGGTVT